MTTTTTTTTSTTTTGTTPGTTAGTTTSGARARAAVLLVAAGAALAGLAPAAPAGAEPAGPAAAVTAAPATTAALPRCHTAQLTAATAGRDAGAGQRYLTLLLTNRGAACTVLGFGGLGLADATGRQLPATSTRTDPAAQLVTLATGASASKLVHYAEGQGQPGDVLAAYLTVIPPDETGRLLVRLDDYVYGGQLNGGAYTAAVGQPLRTRIAGARVRSAPSTTSAVLRTLGAAGSPISAMCTTTGAAVSGDRTWYLVVRPTTGFVSRTVVAPAAETSYLSDC